MPNVPILVDHASLSTGSSNMRDAVEQARAQLSKIRGEVSASQAFWSGSAALSFGNLMTEYDTKSGKLQNALDTIANLVDKSAANHSSNEDLQSRSMNNLMGVLSGNA
ncbi:MAG TPA: WXG100 family type VII secretion target [Stackebrandtia sp.]|jgi:WXG100 family type VII secretion target|uniref:WXG100 family type VII secretion target n=1 Tax=Stackebrandtia sp. TaxID=2023065 RepID=UPI002D2C8459|nr:WXG100 family type VII secretion target [Stackebrandtia sp.]HZE39127.1 WXG100 family type VII secretion target [Stackebrandtia sp.]